MEGKTLLVIQFAKGVRRDEVSYIATLKAKEVFKLVGEIPKEVSQDVMSTKLPKELPPKKEVDHRIELVPKLKPLVRALYRMSLPKLGELRKQLKKLLYARFIRPSKSQFDVPVLFQKNHDGTLKMCIGYQALNKITIKNRYLIPFIADLFDQLGSARRFTKLDFRSGYHEV
ncbi:reverse transcriptase [Gossypium australe]|uniref:Reverse transcriptase n=1 Tax=Gossypium australe TaxID=47621 RepID=A0A5B6V8P4_9ROSI|nr:reverse transcriptase [Gossypium australe]